MGMTDNEPTADEISRAWTIAIESSDIAGARSESLYNLKQIRDKKTTWIGKYEIDLMFAIDDYLRSY